MKILHGTWIPNSEQTFVQSGRFCLWIETSEKNSKRQDDIHPHHTAQPGLSTLLEKELGIAPPPHASLAHQIESCYFLLPTVANQPLLSLELARYLEQEHPETFDFQFWQVDGYLCPAVNVLSLLQDLHFIALYDLTDIHLGSDLLFWYHYTQALKQLVYRDHYIPALRYQEIKSTVESTAKTTRAAKTKKAATSTSKAPSPSQSRTKTTTKTLHETNSAMIYPAWDWVGDRYGQYLETYAESMPLACAAGFITPPETLEFHDRPRLLQHFSECFLAELISQTAFPQAFTKNIDNSLLHYCIDATKTLTNPIQTKTIESILQKITQPAGNQLEFYQQWQVWRDRISHSQSAGPFNIYFQLQEPNKPEDPWQLKFLIAPKTDPSLRLPLLDFWRLQADHQQSLRQQFGKNFEQNLLMNLGYAARIYPKLWEGLDTDEPVGIFIDLDTAFEFLQETAWVLEDAGFKVIIPAWWSAKGRQRAKIRLQARGKSTGSAETAKSYFSYDNLVQYNYELAIGEQPVSEQEWQDLVSTKAPLVQFRGQWIELNANKMAEMLEFWKKQQAENPEMTLLEFMKLTAAEDDDDLDVDYSRDTFLASTINQLQDKSCLQSMDDPQQLQGSLREYQKRGLAWLNYLEKLGLNGCLADDMGLGKTIQVIARLIQEREEAAAQGIKQIPPTLLIAPTSVLGNWFHELRKFAPHLTAVIHHGSDRATESADFKAMARSHDLVITSFTLARKDSSLLTSVTWHRIVLDEAQNIKNPKTAQTKAILKLDANHRLALTGTPVENRLMDLWSIFNFLNPGYLGKQTQFRKIFELPIQKESDPRQKATLKKLVEPFILRRLKTDKSIIKDLPDKVEQKVYCNLTKEQASLYEAVVADITQALAENENEEGIQRKGMILGALTKLKQICNHPRQFLQDDSEFTVERSHKLSRLVEMLAEVIEENESALIFTQFRDIGDALTDYLKHQCYYNTYYIHGGTSRQKREQMIAEFQDEETAPSIFVLSLKAAGVGITLTKANHVFHFDRWWNPAVEDQATDRAFRIGQEKNVFVHKFVAMGTLEERIDEMIEDKKKLAGAIVGADESWLTELDNDSFQKLIALNRSAILE